MELYELRNGRNQFFRVAAASAREAARVLRNSGYLVGSPRGVKVVTEHARSLAQGLDAILEAGRPGQLLRLQALSEDGTSAGPLRWACVPPLDLRPLAGPAPRRSVMRTLGALFDAVDTLLALLQTVEIKLTIGSGAAGCRNRMTRA